VFLYRFHQSGRFKRASLCKSVAPAQSTADFVKEAHLCPTTSPPVCVSSYLSLNDFADLTAGQFSQSMTVRLCRKIVSMTLEKKHGHRVITVADGIEALAKT